MSLVEVGSVTGKRRALSDWSAFVGITIRKLKRATVEADHRHESTESGHQNRPDSAVVQRSPPVPGGRYEIIDRLSGRPASGLLPVSRNTEGPHEPVSIIAELRSATVTHCRRRERTSSYRSLRRIRTSNEPKARRSERSRRSVHGNHSSIVGVAGDARFVDRPEEDQVLTTGGQLRDLAALLHRGEQPAHFRLRPVPAFDDPGLFHATAVRDEQSEDHLLVGQVRPSGMGGSSGNAPSSERSDGTGGLERRWGPIQTSSIGRSQACHYQSRNRAPRRSTINASTQSALGADWIAVSPTHRRSRRFGADAERYVDPQVGRRSTVQP